MTNSPSLLFKVGTVVDCLLFLPILGSILKTVLRRVDTYGGRSRYRRIVKFVGVMFLVAVMFEIAGILIGYLAYERNAVVGWFSVSIPLGYQPLIFVTIFICLGYTFYKFKNFEGCRFQGYYGLLELQLAGWVLAVTYTDLTAAPQNDLVWVKLVTAVYFCARGFENCAKGRLVQKLLKDDT